MITGDAANGISSTNSSSSSTISSLLDQRPNHLVKTFGSKHGEAESKVINQPPPTNLTINTGPPARDMWTPLKRMFSNQDTKYVTWKGKSVGIPLNSTDNDTQQYVIKAAEQLKPKGKGKGWGNNELVLAEESDGSIGIFPFNVKTGVRGQKISTISEENVNINANGMLGTKEKIKAANNTQQTGASGL